MAVAQFYLAGYSIKMEKKETLTATAHTCPVINGWTLIKFSVQESSNVTINIFFFPYFRM